MKRILSATLVLALVLAIFGCTREQPTTTTSVSAGGEVATLAGGVVSSQATGIHVSGEGSVTTKPDLVVARLGVDITEATLKNAQAEAIGRMNAVMAALKAEGIAEKDIQTVRYYVSPERQSTSRETYETVYRVSNIVSVKVRDLSKIGDIIDAVVTAGANQVQSIGFTVEDPTALQKEARKEAMADAKAKAEQLAQLAGVTLGKAFYISEGGGAIPSSSVVREMADGLGGGATPISGGELEVTVQVQVAYAID